MQDYPSIFQFRVTHFLDGISSFAVLSSRAKQHSARICILACNHGECTSQGNRCQREVNDWWYVTVEDGRGGMGARRRRFERAPSRDEACERADNASLVNGANEVKHSKSTARATSVIRFLIIGINSTGTETGVFRLDARFLRGRRGEGKERTTGPRHVACRDARSFPPRS